jgi:hypothetical protein
MALYSGCAKRKLKILREEQNNKIWYYWVLHLYICSHDTQIPFYNIKKSGRGGTT